MLRHEVTRDLRGLLEVNNARVGTRVANFDGVSSLADTGSAQCEGTDVGTASASRRCLDQLAVDTLAHADRQLTAGGHVYWLLALVIHNGITVLVFQEAHTSSQVDSTKVLVLLHRAWCLMKTCMRVRVQVSLWRGRLQDLLTCLAHGRRGTLHDTPLRVQIATTVALALRWRAAAEGSLMRPRVPVTILVLGCAIRLLVRHSLAEVGQLLLGGRLRGPTRCHHRRTILVWTTNHRGRHV